MEDASELQQQQQASKLGYAQGPDHYVSLLSILAHYRLQADHDALDVANRIGLVSVSSWHLACRPSFETILARSPWRDSHVDSAPHEPSYPPAN